MTPDELLERARKMIASGLAAELAPAACVMRARRRHRRHRQGDGKLGRAIPNPLAPAHSSAISRPRLQSAHLRPGLARPRRRQVATVASRSRLLILSSRHPIARLAPVWRPLGPPSGQRGGRPLGGAPAFARRNRLWAGLAADWTCPHASRRPATRPPAWASPREAGRRAGRLRSACQPASQPACECAVVRLRSPALPLWRPPASRSPDSQVGGNRPLPPRRRPLPSVGGRGCEFYISPALSGRPARLSSIQPP